MSDKRMMICSHAERCKACLHDGGCVGAEPHEHSEHCKDGWWDCKRGAFGLVRCIPVEEKYGE